MRRIRFFPAESLRWYLIRGAIIGLIVGVISATLLTLLVAAMSGGADSEIWGDWLASLVLPVLGWGLNGVVIGIAAWLISSWSARRKD